VDEGERHGVRREPASGHSREFHAYVRDRSPALLRTAYLLTGNAEEAEDLLQDALARLLNAWSRVREKDALDAYVRRTMVNLRTSRWRLRRVTAIPVAELPETAVHDEHHAPADRDAMWAALLRLPPRMRAVLVLRFYEDLSEAEAAAALGCSIGTVKSQTSRALAKLREDQTLMQEAVL